MFSIIKNKGIGGSLAIQKPDWRVLRLIVIFLIVYFILGEIFFRLEPIQKGLTGPRIGSRHHQFEAQVARLEKLVNEGETIDCIFLGNSMVWLGINPMVVNDTFRERTGKEIQCFNFGVSALPASSAGQIASMLIKRYHPKVLVYGTFARDFAVPASDEEAYVVSDTPWLRYQNGDFNLLGWLYARSSIFQYKSHIHDLLYMKYLEDIFLQDNIPSYHAFGLDPKFDYRIDVAHSPNFDEIGNKSMAKWLNSYKIYPENMEGLQKIINQSDHSVEIIVVEMPFHNTAYEFFANGKQDYETYIQDVEALTTSGQVVFWRLSDQPILASEYWWDYFHLNLQGANIFSDWLGEKISDYYLHGGIGPFTDF